MRGEGEVTRKFLREGFLMFNGGWIFFKKEGLT